MKQRTFKILRNKLAAKVSENTKRAELLDLICDQLHDDVYTVTQIPIT